MERLVARGVGLVTVCVCVRVRVRARVYVHVCHALDVLGWVESRPTSGTGRTARSMPCSVTLCDQCVLCDTEG